MIVKHRYWIYVVAIILWAIFLESIIADKLRVGVTIIIVLLIIILKELVDLVDKPTSRVTLNIKGDENKILLESDPTHTQDGGQEG